MKKKINKDEEIALSVLMALLEAKHVIELQNNGCCLVSINKAIDLIKPKQVKKKRARK